MRDMGQSFHRDAFAIFAGLERKHVDAIIAALDAHHAFPKAPKTTRGSRLPHDWVLPDDWCLLAREKRFWTIEDTQEEAAAFADYWHSRAGAGAVKVDWKLTWQSWVRNSRRPNGTHSPASRQMSTDDKITSLTRTIGLYRDMGRNSEADDMQRQLDAFRRSNVIDASRRFG